MTVKVLFTVFTLKSLFTFKFIFAIDQCCISGAAGAAGAATFRAVPEPEQIFWLVGAVSWSRTS